MALNKTPSESGAIASDNSHPAILRGKRAAVVVFSHYPSDPRPRRAAEILLQHGMSVDVICLKQTGDELWRENFNGVNILRVPLKRRRGGKFNYIFQYLSFILISFLLLAFRSLTRRYSLVHVHNMPDVLVFSAVVPKVCGAKVILDLHDPMPELMMTIFGLGVDSRGVRLLKWLERRSINFADAVLTVNLACKKIFTARSCPAEKLHVVMNSPDEGIFKFREVDSESSAQRHDTKPFVIMYHGSIVERHGLDVAVDALEIVRRTIPGARMRVYGGATPFLQQVMDNVKARGLQDVVEYLGGRNLDQIVQAIDECDAGIIPNRRSIFTEINTPTRIFEYLSRGRPVIAPLAGGIQDYFGNNDLIYFELGNANDLARKLEYVFAHPADVREIVRRGQEVYWAHRWSEESSRFLALTCELLNCGCRLHQSQTLQAAKPDTI